MSSLGVTIVGAEERIPRAILVRRTIKGETLIAVLRPLLGVGMLATFGKRSFAYVWRGKKTLTGPPESVPNNEALQQLQDLADRPDTQATPADLRGAWSVAVELQNVNQPRITFSRKLGSYQTVRLYNEGATWKAETRQDGKWYTSAAGAASSTWPSLAEALADVLQLGLVGVGKACTTRDAVRRATVDPTFRAPPPTERAPQLARALGKVAKRFRVDPDKEARRQAAAAAAEERKKGRAARRAAAQLKREQAAAAALWAREAKRIDRKPVKAGRDQSTQILRRVRVESSDRHREGTIIADVLVRSRDYSGATSERIFGLDVGPFGRNRLRDDEIRREALRGYASQFRVQEANQRPYEPGGIVAPPPTPRTPIAGAEARILRRRLVAGSTVVDVEVLDAGQRSTEPIQLDGLADRSDAGILAAAVAQLRERGAPLRRARKPAAPSVADEAARASTPAPSPAPMAAAPARFTPGIARWMIARRFRKGGTPGTIAREAREELGLTPKVARLADDAADIIRAAPNARAAWSELQSAGLIPATSPFQVETGVPPEADPEEAGPAPRPAAQEARPGREAARLF